MKRIMTLMMAALLGVTLLAGCGDSADSTDTTASTSAATQQTEAVSEEDTGETAAESTALEVTEDEEKIEISIAALRGPTAIGMVKVMEDAANGTTANHYNFTIAGAADEITASLLNGSIQIAAVPANLASVLYNRSQGGIRVAAINTLGVLYILETGDTIQSVADLEGKTIYSTGAGTTPEYTLRYLLSAYGIDPDQDVTIEYKSEATEVAAILSEAEDAAAMLPQPYVTTVMMNNDRVRIALDVTEEWEAVSENGSSVVTGVVAVNSAFLEENPEAVDAFLEEYEASTAFVNDSVEEAAALVESFDIFTAAVAEQAIPYCNVTFLRGDEMREKLSGYLQTLYDQNADSVGGAMPEDDFYYAE